MFWILYTKSQLVVQTKKFLLYCLLKTLVNIVSKTNGFGHTDARGVAILMWRPRGGLPGLHDVCSRARVMRRASI